MLSVELNKIFKRVAEHAFCLRLFDGDALIVGVDLQNVARVDV